MESLLLGLFSEQLSRYIKGFRKEQVTASLLNGKGEISDVEVNVEPINEILRKVIPYIELKSVYLSKLSFNVTSLTNLKKAPIEIYIDEIHVCLEEPLQINTKDKSFQQQCSTVVTDTLKRGSYNILDRIADNITVEINRVHVLFQPMGRFKTRKIGPWTPPAISIMLHNLRYVSVNEYGEEGSANEVWRHNSRAWRQEVRSKPDRYASIRTQCERLLEPKTFMIYKRLTMELSIGVGKRPREMSAKESFFHEDCFMVLMNVPIQVYMSTHRKLNNASILAFQMDISIRSIEVEINTDTLPLLVETATGVYFCLIKNKSFTDPFNEDGNNNTASTSKKENETSTTDSIEMSESDLLEEQVIQQMEILDDDSDSDNDDQVEKDLDTSVATKNTGEGDSNINDDDWPVIVLPLGLVINEDFGFSLSIHKVGLRAKYHPTKNEYIQLTARGMVAEFMTKPAKVQGLCFQMTMAHMCIQERHDGILQPIIIGGQQRENTTNDHDNGNIFIEMEHNFPMLEQRPIQSDPIDLRTTFPVQAFGFKASIDVVNGARMLSAESKFSILLEIGMNDIDLIVNPTTVSRIISFLDGKEGAGYDPRWISGDWTDTKLLGDINIEDHIQGNESIKEESKRRFSADLTNLTTKFTNIRTTIPAPMHRDLRSSDVVISIQSIMIVLSSALPRIFLSSNVQTTEQANSSSFPNDAKADIDCDTLPGWDAILRFQISLDRLVVEVLPSIPRFHPVTHRIFSSTKLTFLCSYEKQTDDKNIDSEARFIFLSTMLQNITLNVDFDVIMSAISTALYHYELVADMIKLAPASSSSYQLPKINLFLRLDIGQCGLYCWRQNYSKANTAIGEMNLPLLLLTHFSLKNMNVGCQFITHQYNEDLLRHVLKLCVEEIDLDVCDLDGDVVDDEKVNAKYPKCINILSLESKENTVNDSSRQNSFQLRVEAQTGDELICSASAEVMNGEMKLAVDKLISLVDLFIESLLLSWNSCSHTVRNLLTESITSLTPSTSTSQELVCMLLVKFHLENFMLLIPRIDDQTFKSIDGSLLGLVCEETNLNGYFPFGKKVESNHIFHTTSGSDELSWNALFPDITPGFCVNLQSKQRFEVSTICEKTKSYSMKEIAPSFEVKNKISPSTELEFWMSKCKLSMEDLGLSAELLSFLKLCEKNAKSLQMKLYSLAIQLNLLNDIPDTESTMGEKGSALFREVIQNSITCIQNARTQLDEVGTRLSTSEKKYNDLLKQKEELTKHYDVLLFRKEMERQSALALVSNQVSSHIRMGSAALSGQRMVATNNMWRYWAVLSNRILFIYENCYCSKIVDFIKLKDVKLRSLVGTGKKSRAFALVDLNGVKKFFVTESQEDTEMWKREIYKVCAKEKSAEKVETPEMSVVEEDVVDVVDTVDDTAEDESKIPDSNSLPISTAENESELGIQETDASNLEIKEASNESVISRVSSEDDDNSDDISYLSVADDSKDEVGNSPGRNTKNRNPLNRANFREKMSKMKSAVKNVKMIDKDAIKKLNSGSFQKNMKMKLDMPLTSPLQIRANPNRTQLNTKLQIRSFQSGPVLKEPEIKKVIYDCKEIELKKVTGVWCIRTHAIETPSTNENKTFGYKIELWRLLSSNGSLGPQTVDTDRVADVLVTKTLNEIIRFYTDISEEVQIYSDACAERELSCSEQISTCGKVLLALLDSLNISFGQKLLEYSCGAIVNFLEALLSSPLPMRILDKVSVFLKVNDFVLDEANKHSSANGEVGNISQSELSVDTSEVIGNAHSALVQASNLVSEADTIASVFTSTKPETTLESNSIEPSKSIDTYAYDKVMQKTMMTIMGERDSAHVDLIASQVLHVHELEHEQKKNLRLTQIIEDAELFSNRESAAAESYFLGPAQIALSPSKDNDMIQNSDEELLALCNQLSSEISSRVSSDLEIIRLKESISIERNLESQTKTKIQEELDFYKRQVEEEKIAKIEAEKERDKWKLLYHKSRKSNGKD